MERPHHKMNHAWHAALNEMEDHRSWMYEAKAMADEVPRLVIGKERAGELAKVHRQCSHSQTETVVDNHLTCCLGTKCAECSYLLAIESAEMEDSEKDVAKAWTCTGHIVHEGAKQHVDTSEGYVLTVDDRMFWDNVYRSMATPSGHPDDEPTVNLTPGTCPVHNRECEYGCEMGCFLDDMTEEEVAAHETAALPPAQEDATE